MDLICLPFLKGMRTAFLIILMTVAACSTKTSDDSPLEEEIRGSWEQLSRVDGNYVLFSPCEAENFSISWKGDSLLIGWGQETTIEKISRLSTSRKDNVNGVDLLAEGPESGIFRIERVDTMKRVTRWWIPG